MSAAEEKVTKKRKEVKVPHVWTIIFLILIVAGILTYVIPSGKYERVEFEGRQVIDPESFHYVEQTPVPPLQWVTSIVDGLKESMPIMAMVWITISATAIYTESGTLYKIVGAILRAFKGNYKFVFIALMAFFAVRGGMGAFEMHIGFVPMTIALALAMGFDVMTGLAITMVPTFVGFNYGPLNVYTVAVAQGIAGLPIYSAMAFRVVLWLALIAMAFFFVLRYADKVKKDPSASVSGFVNPIATPVDIETYQDQEMNTRDKINTVLLLVTIVLQVVGPLSWKWGFGEFSALWLLSGIAAGLVAGYDNHKIANVMSDASAAIFAGVICVGLARAVSVVLTKGNIIDTIIYALSQPLQKIPQGLTAIGMYLVNSMINFFVPSGSGQATVTMPIMAPLADVIGLTRQTAVMAFQLGDGFSNLFLPTTAAIFMYIGVAKVDYPTYLKWIRPLAAGFWIIGAIGLIIATITRLGPF
jgi:uncharacterized ion transporter superfamily protein YfcC